MNPAEKKIDHLISKLTDWRGKALGHLRKAIRAADGEIFEDWKWMGSPVWSRDGIIAVATVLKDKLKLTFPHGADLPDPKKLFNNGFGGGHWRALDLFEGDPIDEAALKGLVQAAIGFNQSKVKKKAPVKVKVKAKGRKSSKS